MDHRKKDMGLLALWQEAFAGEDDLLRFLVEQAVQRVLEEEITAFLGAESYQRSENRRR